MNCKKCNALLSDNALICNECNTPTGLDLIAPRPARTATTAPSKVEAPIAAKPEIKSQIKTEAKAKTKIEFLAISTVRLVALSVLTLGFYQIYWFYKNWQAVKKADNSNIFILPRSIFTFIFARGLFQKILDAALIEEYATTFSDVYSSKKLARVYFLILIFAILFSFGSSGFTYIICTLLFLASVVPLIEAQNTINYYNFKITGNTALKKRLSVGEFFMVLLGIFILYYHISHMPFTKEDMIKFAKEAAEEARKEKLRDKDQNPETAGTVVKEPTGDEKADLQESINVGVKRSKEQITFPMKLDSNVSLVDITAEPGAIRYHCIIEHLDASKLSPQALKGYLAPNICNGIRSILQNGVNVDYLFTISNTQRMILVQFTKNDCAAANPAVAEQPVQVTTQP